MAVVNNDRGEELLQLNTNAGKDTDTTDAAREVACTRSASAAKPPSKWKASKPAYLHIIKWIALIIIALCVCVGSVLSKITLVSITGRMFSLVSSLDGHTLPQSVLFVQLTLILVIPEAVSFIRCLIWGVIGKTTERFPWPNRSAFIGVSQYIYN